jgi:hypothetical protein
MVARLLEGAPATATAKAATADPVAGAVATVLNAVNASQLGG